MVERVESAVKPVAEVNPQKPKDAESAAQLCRVDVWLRQLQRPVGLELRDPAVAPVPRVLALPENGAALRAPRVDDDLVDVGATDALSDGVDFVRGERAAEGGFELPFARFPLELLRPLVRLSLQFFDLPRHLPELTLF